MDYLEIRELFHAQMKGRKHDGNWRFQDKETGLFNDVGFLRYYGHPRGIRGDTTLPSVYRPNMVVPVEITEEPFYGDYYNDYYKNHPRGIRGGTSSPSVRRSNTVAPVEITEEPFYGDSYDDYYEDFDPHIEIREVGGNRGDNRTSNGKKKNKNKNKNGTPRPDNVNDDVEDDAEEGKEKGTEKGNDLNAKYIKWLNYASEYGPTASKISNALASSIPDSSYKKYGTYDELSTEELNERINRINTEHKYSDLIGDTKTIKTGKDKVREALQTIGSAVSIAAIAAPTVIKVIEAIGNKKK